MMRCLLIDDEPMAIEHMANNLKDISFIQIAGKCRSAAEALAFMQHETVDLLFCDIYMPGINGLQLVESLVSKPLVIFVTAYDKFAVDAFELEVVDFLVKPLTTARFLKACQRAHQLFLSRNTVAASWLVQPKDYLFINTNYTLVKLNFDDIQYIQGLRDYVTIVLTGDQKPIVSRTSLKALESQLPPNVFFRIHKSYLINVRYITQVRRGKVISADVELPLSDNYRLSINKMIGHEIA